jgi:hypothetical protein
MGDQATVARPDGQGRQVVDIVVDGGYRPATIHARSGVPIRLIFDRQDVDSCSERVVFSRPRLDRFLSATTATVVDLPGQAAGEVRFTCGMGRYRGRIHIMDGRPGWTTVPTSRSRWLAAGLVVVVAGVALVLLGIIPASAGVSAALITTVALVHLGSHGRHATHGRAPAADDEEAGETDGPVPRSGCH